MVVELDEAPMTASSSDSRLLAMGWEDEMSFSMMVVVEEFDVMVEVWWDGAEGDCDRDFFERFSKVLTKILLMKKKVSSVNKKWMNEREMILN